MEKEESRPAEENRPVEDTMVEKKKDSPAEKKESLTNKFKQNPWVLSTIVLGAIVLIMLIGGFSGLTGSAITGGTVGVSGDDAGSSVVNFLNSQTGGGVEFISSEDMGSVYKVTVSYQGKDVPVYATKDGEYYIQGLVPLVDASDSSPTQQTPQPTQTDVPKSDKPVVELFVMAFCPYGTQMEKGMLPVVKELGDKIDFEIKFVNYAMHPTKGEVEEELNQYCIQKEQNDKYLDYLSCFLEDSDGERCLKEIKIDKGKLKICTDKTDKEFDVIKNLEDKSSWSSGRFPKFMIYDADNQKYGVQGSPTLIINGEKSNAGRNAQSILDAICSAFTTEPGECGTDMTSFGNPAPGFGFDTQGGSATSAGCGA